MIQKITASLFLCCGLMTAASAWQSPAQAQTSPQAQSSPNADAFAGLLDQPDPEAEANRQKNLMRDTAFNNALDAAMPLTPDQIRQLISRMSDVQRAASPPVSDSRRPIAKLKAETVSLTPGAEPPTVKVASGYVTSLMILDATGAPWPVTDLAFAGKFDVKVVEGSTHVIRILPMMRFQEGNISLQLAGLSAPVILKLVADTDEVYYRYDLRVPAVGPRAEPANISGSTRLVAGDAALMAVLDGYPPEGAQRMKVTGIDDRSAAWTYNGQIYLRTPHSLLSPAWSASVSSGDGTNVYAIPDTPVLLLSDQGVMVRARVSPTESVSKGDMLNVN